MTYIPSRAFVATRALFTDDIARRKGAPPPQKGGFSFGGEAIRRATEEQVMRGLDADQSGGVSLAELSKAAKGATSAADLAARKAFFAQSDQDHNGVLSQAELQETSLFSQKNLASMVGAQGADKIGEVLVSRADEDGDGLLSAKEYARIAADHTRAYGRAGTATKPGTWTVMTDAQIRAEDFGRLDVDKDGQLSAQELNVQFMSRYRSNEITRNTPIAEVFDYLVADGDGDGDGALSTEEIAAAADKAGLEAFDTASLLDDGDADGDGKLSRAEVDGLRSDAVNMSTGFQGLNAGQASLGRLSIGAALDMGDVVAEQLGLVDTPPLKDPEAPWALYKAGDTVSPRDAAAMHPTNFGHLRTHFDGDGDGVLSLGELSEAAKAGGLSALNLTAMMSEMDGDRDGNLSKTEIQSLSNRWFMAAHHGVSGNAGTLSSGEAIFVNLLLSVQRGQWTPPKDGTA